MKTNKSTAGRDAQHTAPANSRAASAPTSSQVMAAGAAQKDVVGAAPPQPNWTRYADSRLRQFYCR
jgi:hypothetical protein